MKLSVAHKRGCRYPPGHEGLLPTKAPLTTPAGQSAQQHSTDVTGANAAQTNMRETRVMPKCTTLAIHPELESRDKKSFYGDVPEVSEKKRMIAEKR